MNPLNPPQGYGMQRVSIDDRSASIAEPVSVSIRITYGRAALRAFVIAAASSPRLATLQTPVVETRPTAAPGSARSDVVRHTFSRLDREPWHADC
jgi:hypothetical protein